MSTCFGYLYRDASNYKVWNEEILGGFLTKEQKQDIISTLEDGEFFIPEQVGLPVNRGDEYTEDDHCFCELTIEDIEDTGKMPTIEMTAEELYENFMKTGGKWNTSIVEWW